MHGKMSWEKEDEGKKGEERKERREGVAMERRSVWVVKENTLEVRT